MPASSEKEKRKAALAALRRSAAATFESTLPMPRALFEDLFDHLGEALEEEECDDTLRRTKTFLAEAGVADPKKVVAWLMAHGGRCDCEVLANVEEKFEV
ncbi:DUF2695 domain-containing protein [Flaviaesturariibacter amylovorans]|uniref:DUF2695 domain-containing protein n=1 Tax=Flaviaesturariibacter amylovorans TaxID=1084520 RepID=A0ABP8G4T4_9BACT